MNLVIKMIVFKKNKEDVLFMVVDRRVVVGTFNNEDEAASEVRRLKDFRLSER